MRFRDPIRFPPRSSEGESAASEREPPAQRRSWISKAWELASENTLIAGLIVTVVGLLLGLQVTKTYKHLRPGTYKFEVRAFNSAGVDPTPATKKVKVKLLRG